MQDQESLFQIKPLGNEPEGALFRVVLNPAHAVFGGHFPDQPVLPGVCSMQIIRRCVELQTGRTLRYGEVRECKFLSTIDPGQTPVLGVRINCCEEVGQYRVTALLTAGEQTAVKLKATLTE